MPSFLVQGTVFSLEDLESANETIDIFTRICMRKAVAAYLRAALSRIPVRTGFLKGAFSELNRFFRPKDSGADLNPVLETFARKHANGDVTVHPFLSQENAKFFKERENLRDKDLSQAGRVARLAALKKEIRANFKRQKKRGQRAKDEQQVEYYRPSKGQKILKTQRGAIKAGLVTQPEDVIRQTGNVITAHIDIDIIYYRINDFYSRVKGAPWNSIKEGTNAALLSLERSVNSFPSVGELLTKVQIALNNQSVTINKTGPQSGVVASRLLRLTGFE